MHYKHFLPLCRLHFHSTGYFLCCADAFKFDAVSVCFSFVAHVFDVISKKSLKIIAKGYTQKNATPEAPAHPCLLQHYSQ
jgi:hypothetical protein